MVPTLPPTLGHSVTLVDVQTCPICCCRAWPSTRKNHPVRVGGCVMRVEPTASVGGEVKHGGAHYLTWPQASRPQALLAGTRL